MDRKKLLIRLTFLIFFIFIVNSIATKFYWYSAIWWFDMPMHFLGGFWVSLALIWLFSYLAYQELSFQSVLKVILGVLLVGILWEVFEIGVDQTISHNPFNALDTFSDIFFDLAGGLSAVFYFYKKTMSKTEVTV